MNRKKSRKTTAYFLAVGVFLFFSFEAFSAFAQGNIRLGRFYLEPGITYKAEYNDNIYSEKTNEQSDYIHTATPSIVLRYAGTSDNFFSIGYNFDLVAYSDKTNNNYQAHRPFLSFGIKTPAGFYVRASDNFVQTADPFGTANQYGIGSKTKRWNNAADVTVGYDFFTRYTVEGMYKNYIEKLDLSKDEWQDRTDHIYGGSFFVRATPLTSFFGQYRRTQAKYDEQDDGVFDEGRNKYWSADTSQDYSLNDYFVGVRFDPGGKLDGEIKAGYGEKKFDNTTDIDGNKYKDESSWVAETTVNYQALAKTRLTLNLQRSHKGSPDADAASYLDTLVGLSLNQKLAYRLSIKLGFDWVNNDYLNETSGSPSKYFDIYTAKTGVEWAIQDWFTTGLEYKHTNKIASNSAYESSEYESNVVSVSVSANF